MCNTSLCNLHPVVGSDCIGPPNHFNAPFISTFSSSQVALRLQKEVEDLVLEVFERLPQTVDGFRDGNIAGSGMEVSRCFLPIDTRKTICFHSTCKVVFCLDGWGPSRICVAFLGKTGLKLLFLLVYVAGIGLCVVSGSLLVR